jgi:hypothetical protein
MGVWEWWLIVGTSHVLPGMWLVVCYEIKSKVGIQRIELVWRFTVCISERSVYFNKLTWRCIPEGCLSFSSLLCENLKSYITLKCFTVTFFVIIDIKQLTVLHKMFTYVHYYLHIKCHIPNRKISVDLLFNFSPKKLRWHKLQFFKNSCQPEWRMEH